MKETILLFRGKYFFLSNFYPCEVTLDGLTYTSSEAAYQAQKCRTDECKLLFVNLNASESRRLGHRISKRKDWEDVKYDCMFSAVKAKFEQNERLKKLLIQTKDAHIEEVNGWNDDVWGTVQDEGGKNLLGKILMQIRSELISKDKDKFHKLERRQ